MPSRTYFALVVIILPPITYALYRYSIGIIVPEFELAYSISDSVMGGIISASIMLVALGAFVSSSVAKKFGEQRTVLLGLSIFSIPLVSIGLSKILLEFFLFLFMLASFGGGLMTPPVYTVALSLLPKRKGTAVSIVTAAYNLGGLIGSPIVGYLLVHYSWNSSFLLIGFVGLGTLFAFLVAFRHEQKLPFPKKTRDGSFKLATRNRTLLVLMVANFFADLAFLTYVSWTPKFLSSNFGEESIATIGTLFGIAVGVGAPGTLIIGVLLDRLGGRKCALINGVIVSTAMLGIYLANSLTVAIAMLMIAGFVANWYFTILTTMAQTTVSQENSTSAISLVQTSGFVGEFIGPGLAGLIGGAETLPLVLTVVAPNLVYTGIMSLAFRSNDRKTTTLEGRSDIV